MTVERYNGIDIIRSETTDEGEIERYNGIDIIRSETTDEGETATESSVEKVDNKSSTEEADSEDPDVSRDGANKTKSVVVGGTTVMTVEQVRRLGIERHAEAGFAEQSHAEAYAKKIGGSVVDNEVSPFKPDGGIDKIVKTDSGKEHIQSKHYGQEVANSTLEEYADEVDVIGATNGIADNADPETYGMDVVTAKDWSWRAKAKLEGRRVIRGCGKGFTGLKNGTRAVTRFLVNNVKFVFRWAVSGGKWLRRRLVKIGSTFAAWFIRRSLVTQLILVVAVVGLIYLSWRWYTSEDKRR